jgi:hypothetical protein
MAAFQKFNSFVEALAEQKHDLGGDTLRILLCNTLPLNSHSIKTDLTEISAGNGYVAGGNIATVTSSAQSGGVYKLVLADPSTWTASGGAMASFRYAVLYNDDATNDELIGYWDYGSTVTLAEGDSFTVDFDPANGVLTIA